MSKPDKKKDKALLAFIACIEENGGVCLRKGGGYTLAISPTRSSLAEAYETACKAMGRNVKIDDVSEAMLKLPDDVLC